MSAALMETYAAFDGVRHARVPLPDGRAILITSRGSDRAAGRWEAWYSNELTALVRGSFRDCAHYAIWKARCATSDAELFAMQNRADLEYRINDVLTAEFPDLNDDQLDELTHLVADTVSTMLEMVPGDPFVIVEGGLVQNTPTIPVFDLDVLSHGAVDQGTVDEVLDLHARANMLDHPTMSEIRHRCESWLEVTV